MENSPNTLIDSTRSTLLEGLALIESVDDNSYATAPQSLQTNSAGNHLRHCLEFFECFLDGPHSEAVDYASRRRTLAVGEDRLLGMLRIAEVVERLDGLRPVGSNTPVLVRAEDELGDVWTPSTVGRELEFLRSHTVHHYALIALILRAHQVHVASSFGVAPSTLRFQTEASACAQ